MNRQTFLWSIKAFFLLKTYTAIKLTSVLVTRHCLARVKLFRSNHCISNPRLQVFWNSHTPLESLQRNGFRRIFIYKEMFGSLPGMPTKTPRQKFASFCCDTSETHRFIKVCFYYYGLGYGLHVAFVCGPTTTSFYWNPNQPLRAPPCSSLTFDRRRCDPESVTVLWELMVLNCLQSPSHYEALSCAVCLLKRV